MFQSEVQPSPFEWLDYTNPGPDLLAQIAADMVLPEKLVLNCLDSDYLPHIETHGNCHFIVLRLMEPSSRVSADSVQELTTKVAIFVNDNKLVSVHRLPLSEIEEIKKKIPKPSRQKLFIMLFEQLAAGFDKPLTELETKLQGFEDKFFHSRKSNSLLQDGFYLKRKASALRKVLRLTLDLMTKIITKLDCQGEAFQGSKDRLERNLFYAEDVTENMQSLLNLHLAIESQKTNEASFRTNEIMRVLTVLTIFFLPLNFIAGVFGMNFQHMPLLTHEGGFWLSIVLMLVISVLLTVYLFKQGWLERPEIGKKNQR